MTSSVVKMTIVAAVAFICLGIALSFGPTMLEGFETMRTSDNISYFTALDTVVQFGPTMILLGFIVSVGIVGFMGLRLFGKR